MPSLVGIRRAAFTPRNHARGATIEGLLVDFKKVGASIKESQRLFGGYYRRNTSRFARFIKETRVFTIERI